MAFGDPTDGAYHFVIEGAKNYDAFIQVLDYEGFSNLDLRYKLPESEKWTWFSSGGDAELNAPQLTTKEDTDAEIDRILDLYNVAIKKAFGADAGTEPEKGLERVRWLIKNGHVTESNNTLTRSE